MNNLGQQAYPAVPLTCKNALKECLVNPTLRENIERKIQFHKDEILRLENVMAQVPALLDVNLRDLREAMNF